MQINEYQKNEFIPTKFMTIYEKQIDNQLQNEFYLEIGHIEKDNDQFKVGVSQPVSKEFLNDLVSNIKIQNFQALRFKAFIPNNVLFYHSVNENPTVMWYRHPESRFLTFKEEIGIESANYDLPRLLFFLHDENLSVFRMDGNIDMETELHLLPLPNIHEDSTVCLGNAKVKKAKFLDDVIRNYEDLFYKTRFNALHNENYFAEGIVYVDVLKNKNAQQWPKKLSNYKTLKKLFNEIS